MRFDRRLMASAMFGLFLGASPARADNSDYWLVQVSADHRLFDFIDASTIARDGPFRSVWSTRVVAGKEKARQELRRTMTLAMLDCGRSVFRESRIVTYDGRGDVLTDRSRDTGDYRKADPESLQAAEIEFVCGNSDRWAVRKGWTEIDTTPEKRADSDYKAFAIKSAQ